jgi:hypothetical protein
LRAGQVRPGRRAAEFNLMPKSKGIIFDHDTKPDSCWRAECLPPHRACTLRLQHWETRLVDDSIVRGTTLWPCI